jgi:thioesterase domain-containing protein
VYNPIVPLQPHGSKTPLFLIHPGSGDVLVFVALAAHFPTRPVYALRTRGYNPNERLFRSMKETIQTYTYHIRKTQPKGPYALAGYSLGSTLAFEVAKRLEAQGQEVRFLGSIDYPPYIAEYISGQNWIDVLVQISFFLELIDEETMKTAMAFLHKQNLPREDALAHILSLGDCERVDALGLNLETLGRIVDIAENFRVQGEVYQPRGSVDRIDIFVADPPSYTSTNRQDWRDNKLGRWREFSRSGIEFYECPSTHTKMLNPEHVPGFVKRLKAAMKKRRV